VIAFVTDELPRPGTAGHLALNHAIIDWLQQEGFAVTILLTGSRLAWPVQRYTKARVMGPHVTQLGPYLGALSPLTALGISLRRPAAARPSQCRRGTRQFPQPF